MIKGNHDRFSTREGNVFFSKVTHYHEKKIFDRKFVMCHYPMEQWNGSFHTPQSIHVHGHVHIGTENGMKKKANRVNVNVEFWNYKPVSAEKLIEYVKDN